MSYKPTNEDLMAYLYGELDESAKAQLDQYFKEHPEARTELTEMEETRVLMSQWEDEEVPVIPGFIQPHENSEWLYWRKYVAIAASILLIITLGWASKFNVSYGEDGFHAGFTALSDGLSMEEVAELLAKERENILAEVDNDLQGLQVGINDNRSFMENSMERFNELPEDQINNLLSEQKQQIVAEMNQLSDKLTDDYREVFRQLVVSFSNNFETQRIQDLRNVEAAFNDLEDAITSKQEVFEEALYSLSVEVDALTPNNNN
ncbi:MAG: hypothetical protein HEP71_24135 [Roseivirga sp.]|nr:hypothetical protein [Roseivirga sp.]